MRVGLLWRREWDPVESSGTCKLCKMFSALAELGVAAEPVVYSDDVVDAVREQLLALDAVLVWVNPIEQGLDRTRLDALLRDAASAGVFVSAHPDVILAMGTKQVLWDTRTLSWSSDVRVYGSAEDVRRELPSRLATGARVLKQYRGMGGNGVWKVAAATEGDVLVQHASGAVASDVMPFEAFIARCAGYLEVGPLVEQPFLRRLAEGMIRAYLSGDTVVGFTHQYPRGLMPPGDDNRPTGKRFEPETEPRYSDLRNRLELEWVPEMQRLLSLETRDLPLIWDADFLFGDEQDYVLCEINCSSTFAFPEFAMPTVARATIERIGNAVRR